MPRYRIANRDNAAHVSAGGERLYWNDSHGWVSKDQAQTYDVQGRPDPDSSLLPTVGVWEPCAVPPAPYLPQSPEADYAASCHRCAAQGSWKGIDLASAQLQRFTADHEADSLNYDGADPDVGEFQLVLCDECGAINWYDADYFIPDALAAAMLRAVELNPLAHEALLALLVGRRVSSIEQWSEVDPDDSIGERTPLPAID